VSQHPRQLRPVVELDGNVTVVVALQPIEVVFNLGVIGGARGGQDKPAGAEPSDARVAAGLSGVVDDGGAQCGRCQRGDATDLVDATVGRRAAHDVQPALGLAGPTVHPDLLQPVDVEHDLGDEALKRWRRQFPKGQQRRVVDRRTERRVVLGGQHLDQPPLRLLGLRVGTHEPSLHDRPQSIDVRTSCACRPAPEPRGDHCGQRRPRQPGG
jgi:hypothetical protein